MAAGVRDIDRRRVPGVAVAAHAPGGHPPVRSCRLRADAPRPRCTARLSALVPACLVFILGGIYAAGWLVYGTPSQPYLFGHLPLPAAVYGVLVFPFIWGLTEQMTYNGYLLPRFQVLCRSTSVAIAVVAFVWSMQHAFMPLTFDAKFMAYRLLASVPFSVFQTLLYLRLRRIVPFVIAHALLDGATVLIPLLRE